VPVLPVQVSCSSTHGRNPTAWPEPTWPLQLDLEGSFLNAAGLAFVNQTELRFANTQYLSGSGISLNTIGFATSVGDGSVLGLTVMTMGFGDIANHH
jgi:hypothetical protein